MYAPLCSILGERQVTWRDSLLAEGGQGQGRQDWGAILWSVTAQGREPEACREPKGTWDTQKWSSGKGGEAPCRQAQAGEQVELSGECAFLRAVWEYVRWKPSGRGPGWFITNGGRSGQWFRRNVEFWYQCELYSADVFGVMFCKHEAMDLILLHAMLSCSFSICSCHVHRVCALFRSILFLASHLLLTLPFHLSPAILLLPLLSQHIPSLTFTLHSSHFAFPMSLLSPSLTLSFFIPCTHTH